MFAIRLVPVYDHQTCLFIRRRDVFYVQHSDFGLFVLAEISSKNRRLKLVVALRLEIETNYPCHPEKRVVNGMNRPSKSIGRKLLGKNRLLYFIREKVDDANL